MPNKIKFIDKEIVRTIEWSEETCFCCCGKWLFNWDWMWIAAVQLVNVATMYVEMENSRNYDFEWTGGSKLIECSKRFERKMYELLKWMDWWKASGVSEWKSLIWWGNVKKFANCWDKKYISKSIPYHIYIISKKNCF